MTSTATRRAGSARWVPFALVALSLFPIVAGSLRLVEVFGGPHLMPANVRLTSAPVPLVVHIAGVIPYALLGALQFSSQLRRRRPGWHRVTGRVLVVLGLAVALSGLWLTVFYPGQENTGELLYVARLAAGSAMAASIVLGFAAIRRGDVARHRAWMTRAYALALGAGTQVLTGAARDPLLGTGVLANDIALTSAWVINLAVAEYVIRRHGPRVPARRHRAAAARG